LLPERKSVSIEHSNNSVKIARFFIPRRNSTMFSFTRTISLLRATFLLAIFALAATTASFSSDTSSLTWTKLTPTKGLPPREAFASTYDPISKKIIVFGGINGQTYFDDTYSFDGTTWAKVQTKVAPPARAAAMMAYDRKIKKLVLFGGAYGFARLGDTWLWDGATSTWTAATPKTVPPGASGPILFTDPLNG